MDVFNINNFTFNGFLIMAYIVDFIFVAIAIYSFILFIKIAKRGIKALDIYLNKHKNI